MKAESMAQQKITSKQKDRMIKILGELKHKMKEIDRLRAEIERETPEPISTEQARAMLEEIKVPPLEVITDSGKKRR